MRLTACDICGKVAGANVHTNALDIFLGGVAFSACEECRNDLVDYAATLQSIKRQDFTEVEFKPVVELNEIVDKRNSEE